MKLALILTLLLTACSSPPTPAPKPLPILTLTPANCPQVRFLLNDGTYSVFWGGTGGTVVPVNGLSIQANPKQVECKYDGVFKPFQAG